ncbi:enhancer of mRNA-decapping protein 4 isoform X2 [Pseudochaenichthys georgianus]|uniref:enhancer of mRNA-decapping protein 4 isoform X2 n=1 Tax=Pseudochaenichthys georgianus TaxID=52239 RepID=UPI00146B224E|nr:enhancer of mRNA-decapping protein 4 isoform X2 [Pseudochaenichthys georgianus]
MASNSNIDIEGATQHLRDILKLDRPGNSTDAPSSDGPRMPSFNGELNGLLGAAGLLGNTDRSTMSDSTRPISTDLCSTQECQIICLSGDNGSTSLPITSNNVEIVASQDSSINSKARGSNKVKIQPVAKYDWEHKYYYGRLIAVSNSFVAYAIRGANNHAMIRVLSVGSAERSLLKGFTGAVTDLAFAHLDSSLLGCVDEAGNLMVWQLTCTASKILDQVVVHIRRPEDSPLNSHRRLIWCPFIQEDNEENQDDPSQTLALLHEDLAEVWDLEVLRATYSSWPVDAADVKDGLITVKGHTQRVSEGALSPDGTVLATASHDGYIKFWQIYIEGGQDQPRFVSRCLHELRPHGGRPLSCLLFCDNHKRQDPEVPFWRFLITGADQNQELKLWCTVSWTCLQTIRFSPDLFNSSVLPSLKASLDLSSEFLILTDVQRKVLYVMELRQDLDKGMATFTAVSEFLLTHPVLSFGVRDVAHSRLRHTEVLPAEEESESLTTEGIQGPTESKSGIQIKLYCVHTKSLQDVQIWFQPNLSSSFPCFLPHSDSQDGFGFSDHLTDQSSDKESGSGSQTDLRKIPSLPAPTDFLSNSGANSITKLMTPDAFMTPSASVPASPGSSASSLTIMTAISSNSDSTNRAMDDLIQTPNRAENTSSSSLALSTSSPRPASAVLLPGLESLQALASPSGPLALDGPQVLDAPLLPPLASPTRARSPDVISSASTAMSQDMPEIASQTLQLQRVLGSSLESSPLSALQTDSMASAASALHLLTSPRTANSNSLLSLELGGADISVGGGVESEPRLSNTPSLLENALSQKNPGAGGGSEGSISHTPWPAAPDITRETRNSLRDNGLGDCSREEAKDRHLNSPYHRRSYHLTQNDSQDAGAEQSDPDDEVPTMAASSGNCGRSSHRLPVKEWKTSPRGSPKVKRKTKKDDSESSLSRQMESSQMNAEVQDELLMLLRSQQRELTELRGQITAMQSTIMVQVEHVLSNHQEQEQRRLERVLAESQNHQQQLQDQLSQQLSHTLSSVLTNRMDKVLREEMKKTVPQTISKSLEPVTGQLNNTIAAKLTAVEITLKDNVSKVVKSKNMTDAIGRAAAEAMQGPIQAAYKDAFQSIVLPVFERGCQSMFQQINDSFKQGTQEYIQQLESHMKNRLQRELEAREPVVGQLQQMIESFQSSTDQLANNITANVRAEVQHQIQMMVGNLQETILSHVQRIVKGEVTMAMKEQQAVVTSSIMQAMRSAAGTPVPTAHHDYQTQQANILQLLQQGQLNQAFQQALSATDLNLVLYVCETIDSQQVFGQHPCTLSQPVLLSLIQQLSSNLTTRSELKISYLEDAVMNLDHGDPLTRDHMSSVLAQVRPKLFTFLQQDPHSPLSKRARRLMMMLQGLVSH